jgi:Heterokaryon incompatibility protein (HET)
MYSRPCHERRHHNIRDLESAVQDGYHLCSLLYSHISAEDIERWLGNAEHYRAEDLWQFTIRLVKSLCEVQGEKVYSWQMFMMFGSLVYGRLTIVSTPHINHLRFKYAWNYKFVDMDPVKFAQPSDCKTNSASSLDQIRAWLQECLLSHGPCNDSHTDKLPNRKLPSRLIDGGSSEEQPLIRLVDSSHLSSKTQYIALSHCWGGRCPMTFTKRTAASLFRCIDPSTLPRTFDDAIWLARKIGIRYLWIDALCIVQDSEEDWRIESSRMLDVYSRATLTVAATASRSSEGGLFFARSSLRSFLAE